MHAAHTAPLTRHTCLVWALDTKPRRAPVVATAGLRKETKRLTKALKTHRTRLESLVSVVQQQQAATCAAAMPHQHKQRLSPSQLHAVLAEVAQLQTSLAAVQQQQRQLAALQTMQEQQQARAGACDSSDSDSECADTPRPPRRRQQRAADLQDQQQQQQMGGARSSSRQPVVAAAAVLTTCPQPPAVDFEDITLQLPPPQAYAEAGRVLVCQGKACMRRGALQVLQAASHAAAASPGLEVLPCKCLGKCKAAPAVRVRSEAQPRSAVFTEVAPLEVPDILDHVLGSR